MTAEATIRAAIGAAITSGCGLAADRVRWARQGRAAARPETPDAWISMAELGESDVGRPYVRYERAPLAFADKPVAGVLTGAPGALTVTAHGLQTGDGPVRVETTGAAPGGLAIDTDYWAIRVDANTLRLAPSFLAAVESPAPLAIASAGSGAHALAATDATLRAGAEVNAITTSVGLRTISVQCYGGDGVDDASPLSILRRLRAALHLPAIRAALHAAGVGLQGASAPRDISAAVSPSRFEPRAVTELAFYVAGPALIASETIIESLQIPLTVTP